MVLLKNIKKKFMSLAEIANYLNDYCAQISIEMLLLLFENTINFILIYFHRVQNLQIYGTPRI